MTGQVPDWLQRFLLIENSVKGIKMERSIIGIGLNLNQEVFISDAPNPVSLKQIDS